jgi:separase
MDKDEGLAQKENVKGKVSAAARRRGGTTTATTTADVAKQTPARLSTREKYILATEVANTTLKNLAEALKSAPHAPVPRPSSQSKPTPAEDARKPSRPRTGHAKSASASKRPLTERSVSQLTNSHRKPLPRRSSSYSSILTTGPDAGLVATAECARTAFAYLGTPEATKLLGKDAQELQLENGILALVGKLVALGLDTLAVKEMRHLKKRLDKYLGRSNPTERAAASDKESLATLLDFGPIDLASPALPVITNLQTYVLRVIAKLDRPSVVEATWEHLKLSKPTSPANLIQYIATTSNSAAKAARQLETLAQTILALCPNISSSLDDKPLQPSPETVLLLQHLAFKVRQIWWALAKHQCDFAHELVEPFNKFLVAFARRSRLPPSKKYKLAESLYVDLIGPDCTSDTAANSTLSSLAQAAGMSEDALRWLGTRNSTSPSAASQSKQTARLVRIAAVSIEAFVKGDAKADLNDIIASALEALQGGLTGSTSDLDALFLETNALRRAATRLLIARPSDEEISLGRQATRVIASTVHYSARMVGARKPDLTDMKARQRHNERMTLVSKCTKSIIDSVMACCKGTICLIEQWTELDIMLQECAHILLRLEEEVTQGENLELQDHDTITAMFAKLSNAYWAVCLQLRKAKLGSEAIVTAMQRSVNLISSRSCDVKTAGHLTMKLEHLGDTYESTGRAEQSRRAFGECIRAHVESITSQALSNLSATSSLQEIFETEGPLGTFVRVIKSYHKSFVTSGISRAEEFAFFDDLELSAGARGTLLELQLGLYMRTLSKNRQWDTGLNPSISILIERLRSIYKPEQYPLRHLRLQLILLQLSQNPEAVVSRETAVSVGTVRNTAGSEDESLARFEAHLGATYSLKMSLQQDMPPTAIVRECFSAWESLVDAATSWQGLVNSIDDVEYWIADIKATVEFLNAKGEEYMALPVLHLLVKVGELQKASDPSELVAALCALGLQLLRLGYTGKAGLSLAKAEALVTHRAPSTEARLRWHIAYAEYLARIGNSVKW